MSAIYPYFNTENYDPNDKFIIWFNKDKKASSTTKCFSNKSEIEEFLQEIEL